MMAVPPSVGLCVQRLSDGAFVKANALAGIKPGPHFYSPRLMSPKWTKPNGPVEWPLAGNNWPPALALSAHISVGRQCKGPGDIWPATFDWSDMKASERLKEIEELMADYARPNSTTDGGNLYSQMPWLIARVKRLTEALELVSKDVYELNPWTVGESNCAKIARRALEDEHDA